MQQETRAFTGFVLGAIAIIVPVGTLLAWGMFELCYFIGDLIAPGKVDAGKLMIGFIVVFCTALFVGLQSWVWRRL